MHNAKKHVNYKSKQQTGGYSMRQSSHMAKRNAEIILYRRIHVNTIEGKNLLLPDKNTSMTSK